MNVDPATLLPRNIQLFHNLRCLHRVEQVLLVCIDEHRHARQVLLRKQGALRDRAHKGSAQRGALSPLSPASCSALPRPCPRAAPSAAPIPPPLDGTALAGGGATHQLLRSLVRPSRVGGVDHVHDRVGVLVVVLPVRPDVLLACGDERSRQWAAALAARLFLPARHARGGGVARLRTGCGCASTAPRALPHRQCPTR
eukprot:3055845-Prymnesium_polylepis.1